MEKKFQQKKYLNYNFYTQKKRDIKTLRMFVYVDTTRRVFAYTRGVWSTKTNVECPVVYKLKVNMFQIVDFVHFLYKTKL